ncbi:hypothetical protein [Methylobacterium sp.]|uniref:Cap15 family cyclic dinucleotide receptor domain-containing protein n=1 Tax=Methylobacterium sp. TaxID=409 RepID=UPI00257DEE76|nr:hypothetical protein [Methylobacterium sp.]
MGKLDHEYSIVGGYNRSKIGHWIGGISVLVSSIVVSLVLFLIDVAKRLGFNDTIPPLILWPIGAGTIYVALYWFFESRFWRNRYVNAALKVPDVEGTWQIEGQKLREDGSIELEWSGSLTIVQSWDFIRIYLKTATSESDSISAAMMYDKSIGYKLMYTYRNRPKADQPHLAAHNGYAELLFDPQLRVAEGDYFNGRGRYSYGTMKLTKVDHGA